jgi:hypothetical protein
MGRPSGGLFIQVMPGESHPDRVVGVAFLFLQGFVKKPTSALR